MTPSLRIAKPLWNEQEQLVLLGNIELFAFLLGRCYHEMTPAAKAGALELASALSRLKTSLQPKKDI